MTIEEKERWENVKYRMREEGFHYCFASYSDFPDIKDEKFHELRLKYLATAKEIQNYVDAKCDEEEDVDGDE